MKRLTRPTSEERPIRKRAFEVAETHSGDEPPVPDFPRAYQVAADRRKRMMKRRRAPTRRLITHPALLLAGSRASPEYTSTGIQAIQRSGLADNPCVKSCESDPLTRPETTLPGPGARVP